MKALVYNQEGKEIRELDLPEQLFGVKWNAELVHQVITSLQASLRSPIAHAKGRGEVSGGGKKPWKQKGTGRARHGSTRSPLWRHGGVTHGPTNERLFDRKVNKKMKAKALTTILSRKAKEGEVMLLEDLHLAAPKTKQASEFLKRLAEGTGRSSLNWKKGSRALVLIPDRDPALARSFRNIPSVLVEETRNLGPLDALRFQYIVLARPEANIAILSARTQAQG